MRLLFQCRGETLEFAFYGVHDDVKARMNGWRPPNKRDQQFVLADDGIDQ